ncbi:hypothetical protein ACQW02_24665 [Humitalea sp. 24SJ18S-53]|uniref:hypothetical protein n=1 Tax=Humitalea sp. 24SJ18S-53 TaxID=3422307 RepID=UPI003D66E879
MATRGLPHWPWQGHETADLPAAESVLVDATRRWAEARVSGWPSLPALHPPLAASQAEAAARPLDALLHAIAAGRPLRVGTQANPCVLGCEPLLLMGCTLTQAAPRAHALAAWCALLPPCPAYAAMGHALAVGVAFRHAGLVFSGPLVSAACFCPGSNRD